MRNIKTREGFEFWDKLNALPRYAFLLSPSGKSVQKFEDQAMGNWIDVHEAQKIVDQAQDQISELQDELERQKRYVEINANSAQGKHAEGQRYRDERDALQQRMNAADQRIDELTSPFQPRVQPWLMDCFGPMIAGDREERNHRFLEEALELVQACGCGATEAHKLVDYVYGRDVGEPAQEVGGVMVTLAALCLANDMDMHAAGETELARIWTKVEQIRAKQAAKPQMSPLPGAYPQRTPQ